MPVQCLFALHLAPMLPEGEGTIGASTIRKSLPSGVWLGLDMHCICGRSRLLHIVPGQGWGRAWLTAAAACGLGSWGLTRRRFPRALTAAEVIGPYKARQ
jgi:hypothetical protein